MGAFSALGPTAARLPRAATCCLVQLVQRVQLVSCLSPACPPLGAVAPGLAHLTHHCSAIYCCCCCCCCCCYCCCCRCRYRCRCRCRWLACGFIADRFLAPKTAKLPYLRSTRSQPGAHLLCSPPSCFIHAQSQQQEWNGAAMYTSLSLCLSPSLSSPVLPLTRCVIATGDAAGHGTPYGAQDEVLYLRHASGCGALARSTGLGELPTSLLTYNRFMPRPAEQPPSPLPLPLPPLLLPPIPRHDPHAHSSLIRRASPCTPGVMYLVPALDWTGLDWTALHCTALHCTALHYTTLHYTACSTVAAQTCPTMRGRFPLRAFWRRGAH